MIRLLIFHILIFTFPLQCLFAEIEYDKKKFPQNPYQNFVNYETFEQVIDVSKKKYGPEGMVNDTENTLFIQSLIDETYSGLKELYPRWISNKDKPVFVTIDRGAKIWATAHAGGARIQGKPGWSNVGFLAFSSQTQSQNIPKGAKIFLVAHEMAHLFLFHNDRPKIAANGIPETMKPKLYELDSLQKIAGNNSHPTLLGLSPALMLTEHIEKLLTSDSRHCNRDLAQSYDSIKKLWKDSHSEFRGRSSNDTEASHIENLKTARALLKNLKKCTDSLQISTSYPAQVRYSSKLSYGRAISLYRFNLLSKSPRDLKYSTQELIELLTRINKRIAELKVTLSPYNYRFYTIEDQADEVAASVAKSLGYTAQDTSKLFLSFFDNPSHKEICKEAVRQGRLPDHGSVRLIHHTHCWRYKNFFDIFSREKRLEGLE